MKTPTCARKKILLETCTNLREKPLLEVPQVHARMGCWLGLLVGHCLDSETRQGQILRELAWEIARHAPNHWMRLSLLLETHRVSNLGASGSVAAVLTILSLAADYEMQCEPQGISKSLHGNPANCRCR